MRLMNPRHHQLGGDTAVIVNLNPK